MISKINIPNILSFYRLISFPVVLIFALLGYENLFVVLLVINLITDIFDGLIARMLKQQTEYGARLDSIADIGTYILAVTGVFVFKWNDFAPHMLSFGTFLFLFVFSNLLSVLKFRRFPSLHLYSWKIGGYIQGAFFFALFVFGFNIYFYYFMVFWGILSFIEHITIQLMLSEMKSNQKGLYWVIKNKN